MTTHLSFEQFLEQVVVVAVGYRVKPSGMYGYEKSYWRELYDQGLTPEQAWRKNR